MDHYPSTCIGESSKYLKIIADTSVIECDEITIGMDTTVTKKTNTIATNVTSTVSINCHSKKVRDCYIIANSSISDHVIIGN